VWFSRWKTIHWVLLGLAIVTCVLGAALVWLLLSAASSLDTDRDLEDFATPAEARAFTTAHLPVSLPSDVAIESLHYERFTDWHFTARVRFPSLESANHYLDQTKRARTLNDSYCSDTEPTHGARYFLADVHACGSLHQSSPLILDVRCHTR
jgi:hypothetical protein